MNYIDIVKHSSARHHNKKHYITYESIKMKVFTLIGLSVIMTVDIDQAHDNRSHYITES